MKIKKITYILFIFVFFVEYGYSQNVKILTPSETLQEISSNVNEGNLKSAAQLMYSYISQTETSKSKRVIKITQDIRYQLSTLLIQLKRLEEASLILVDYLNNDFIEHPSSAVLMQATCEYELKRYPECINTITNALSKNHSIQETKNGNIFSISDLTTMNLMLADSFFYLNEWNKSKNAYEFVVINSEDLSKRGYAIMQLISSLLKEEKYEQVSNWIYQLYKTDARYDMRVNAALIKAADTLYQKGEYDSSLVLYRMILSKEELIDYHKNKLQEYRIDAGLEKISDKTINSNEELLFGFENAATVKNETINKITTFISNNKIKSITNVIIKAKSKEVYSQEDLLSSLIKMDDYGSNIDYKMAELYKDTGRYYESIAYYNEAIKENVTQEILFSAEYEISEILLYQFDDYKTAENRISLFIKSYPQSEMARRLIYMISNFYQNRNDMKGVKNLEPLLNLLNTSVDNEIIKQYDEELWLVQGIADLSLGNIEKSEIVFTRLLSLYPDSIQTPACEYWLAVSKLYLQKYQEALKGFKSYLINHPTEAYIDQCNYQIGLCYFGMEDYESAISEFTKSIELYPASSIYADACSLKGDICASTGNLDEAIYYYNLSYQGSKNIDQANYALFQKFEIMFIDEQFDNIISDIDHYVSKWNHLIDLVKVTLWRGKIKMEQGQLQDAFDLYFDTILEYGDDLNNDGVDIIIKELGLMSDNYLSSLEKNEFLKRLDIYTTNSESEVLGLRIKYLINYLNKNEIKFGRTFLKDYKLINKASPIVLSCICSAALTYKNFEISETIFNIFRDKYGQSEFMKNAYKLSFYKLLNSNDYDNGLILIDEIQKKFGYDPDMSWAQLEKIQIFIDSNELKSAYEECLNLINASEWRGKPAARATFQLGKIKELQGDFRQAFGFYQRTYFQYKVYDNGYWAAEAYLASVRCLKKLGLKNDIRNTYRAMLFDEYVNKLPQSKIAEEFLGTEEVREINDFINAGGISNIQIIVTKPLR